MPRKTNRDANTAPRKTNRDADTALRLAKHLWVFAAIVCMVGAQLHVWAEFDPCLWKPATAGEPHRGTSHGSSGHGCPGCFSGSWATTASLPVLAIPLWASRLEMQTPRVSGKYHLTEVSSPRAPPSTRSRQS